MKRLMLIFGSVVTVTPLLFSSENLHAAAIDGKSAFDSYCSGCHPKGKTPQNPSKSLHKINREANGIRDVNDIVRIMRKPGKGMREFTKKEIPDKTAKAIAEYIINTFR